MISRAQAMFFLRTMAILNAYILPGWDRPNGFILCFTVGKLTIYRELLMTHGFSPYALMMMMMIPLAQRVD